MDIKAKIEELTAKIKGDPKIASKFTSDPTGTIEDLVGVKLPKEQLDGIVDAVKAKISLDKLGGLFGKK